MKLPFIKYTWKCTKYRCKNDSLYECNEYNKWRSPKELKNKGVLKYIELPITFKSGGGVVSTICIAYESIIEIRPKNKVLRVFDMFSVSKRYLNILFREKICNQLETHMEMLDGETIESAFMRFKTKGIFEIFR